MNELYEKLCRASNFAVHHNADLGGSEFFLYICGTRYSFLKTETH
jgi:hypothetical protein